MPRRYTSQNTINDKLTYNNITYSEIELSSSDIYIYTTVGDRYDSLAYQYYKDSSLWFIIAIANPSQPFDSLSPEIGVQIRIPSIQNVSNLFTARNPN